MYRRQNHHQVLQKLLTNEFGGDEGTVGVEIGTFCGDGSRAILNALPDCTLYTIDPWKHVDGKEFEAGNPQEYHDKNRESALAKLEAFGDRVKICHCTSEVAYDNVIPRGVDFVWIDGDHSGDVVKKDIEMYEPLVKPGTGLIGGHDFGQVWPLTDIIFKKFDSALNSGNDFTWWVYL
jgi:predicted O-methyltransferase YrrM